MLWRKKTYILWSFFFFFFFAEKKNNHAGKTLFSRFTFKIFDVGGVL